MNKKLYASNYQQRRNEAFIRSGGRCENMVNGERCQVKLGDVRLTRAKNLQFEDLICHHPNGDPENPEAELLIICCACHMRLHRRPGPGRKKASARKNGYEVIRVPHLMELLCCSGFTTWQNPDGGVCWRIGALVGEAHDAVEAIAIALHWMSGEIRSLQEKLDQATFDATLTPSEHDLLIRQRDAERRRASDRALREAAIDRPDQPQATKQEVLTYA